MLDIKIETNPITGGQSTLFKKGNDYFWADRSFVPYTGMETMIFSADKEGNVIDWMDLYCDRSGKSLEECIREFLNN